MHINFDTMGISPQEWEQNNERLHAEMEERVTEPFSFEAFKKTDHEKAVLATAKLRWKHEVKLAGLNPKRVINAPFMH